LFRLAPLSSLNSYLNLYRTIPLRKLAVVASAEAVGSQATEATADTLRDQLVCLKFKTQTYVDERARFVDDPRFRLYAQRLRMRMQSEPDSTDASYYLDGVRRPLLFLFLCLFVSLLPLFLLHLLHSP
jgi:hypothetical protein